MAKSFSARGFESLELRTLSLEILSSKQKGISSVKSFRWRVQMKFLAIILTAGTHL